MSPVLVALAAVGGPENSVAVQAAERVKAAARAEANAAMAQALQAAAIAHLTALYGPYGLWAGNKAHEQEMRVLQLLHMDNRMNILQAVQGSSSEVRDFCAVSPRRDAFLVHPGSDSFAHALPVSSGAKRRAVNMPADEVSKQCRRRMGQPQLLENERRLVSTLDSPVAHHRRRNAIAHEGAWAPILSALPCYRQRV